MVFFFFTIIIMFVCIIYNAINKQKKKMKLLHFKAFNQSLIKTLIIIKPKKSSASIFSRIKDFRRFRTFPELILSLFFFSFASFISIYSFFFLFLKDNLHLFIDSSYIGKEENIYHVSFLASSTSTTKKEENK